MDEIRNVSLDDVKDILNIYSYYIKNTAITFEINVPKEEDFKLRIKEISNNYPYIVLLKDGIIKGFAYSHIYYGRDAYKYSHEVSIYIDKDSKGLGYGKKIYLELESRLKKLGIINLYAAIALPTIENDKYLDNASELFHLKMGYKRIGLFSKCGYKFNNWYDLIWMEKIIGNHN